MVILDENCCIGILKMAALLRPFRAWIYVELYTTQGFAPS